jgi:hypothetical protein
VDAVNSAWRVFTGLVFQRWVLVCLLALFYIPALFVPPYYQHAPLGLLLAAIPAGAMGFVATERVIKYCVSAAELGVPRHTPSVRSAQLLVIMVFAIVPGVLSLVRGAPPLPVAALLLGALSFGTLLMTKPVFFCLFLLGLAPGTGKSSLVSYWLALPAVRWVILVLSLYQLVRWLRLPQSASALRLRLGALRVDTGHGRRPVALTVTGEPDSAAHVVRERLEVLDEQQLPNAGAEQFSIALRGVTPAGISEEALGMGLGFAVTRSWRARLNSAALGIACLAVAHFWRSGQYQYPAYLVITALAASAVAGGVLPLSSAWLHTPVEQGLLLLTARWPASKVVKLSLNTAMFRAQMGGWVGWALIVLVCGGLGWIEPRDILFGMFVLFASMCSALGAVWALFALPSVRETNVSTVAILLLAAVGVACYWAGAVVLGFVFVLGPASLALLAMLLRPLQFPVERKFRRAR